MRAPRERCRNGHKMSGKNLLWHTRYDCGEMRLVRECRVCANQRYRNKRNADKRRYKAEAERRNRKLELEAQAASRGITLGKIA